MRITFLLSSLKLSGGVRVIVEYANRMAIRGHDVTLIAPGDPADPEINERIHRKIQIAHAKRELKEAASWFGKILLTIDMAAKVPPSDIVMATHTPTTAVSWIATNVRKRGIPVWLCQDYPEMFEHRRVEAYLYRNAARWHRSTLVVSDYLRTMLDGYDHDPKIVYVGEGLSNPDVSSAQSGNNKSAHKSDEIYLLYLGDQRPRKGLDDFLEASSKVFEKYPNIHLWIASKEPCSIISKVPLTFFQRPSDLELARLYSECDIFVSTSWAEGFGLPPLEAMACGAPVVMTDTVAGREYARHEENCLLIPPKDSEAAAQAILRLIADDRLQNRLRENGPMTAAQFKWEDAADRFEKALLEVSTR